MIKVNKEVAKRLRTVDSDYIVSETYKLYMLLDGLYKDGKIMQDWLYKNNITITDLLTAFTDGYEEICEFKVGDVVISQRGALYTVVETDEDIDEITLGSLVEMIKNGRQYKLVCKAEDRLDLKEDE